MPPALEAGEATLQPPDSSSAGGLLAVPPAAVPAAEPPVEVVPAAGAEPPAPVPPVLIGASAANVKVQYTVGLHLAPSALHLQLSSVVHQPSLFLGELPAGLQTYALSPTGAA